MPPRRNAKTESDRSPVGERSFLAHRAYVAMSYDFAIEVHAGKPLRKIAGKLAMITNDHLPRLSSEDGGSNLTLHFEHGTQVPLESVVQLERAGL